MTSKGAGFIGLLLGFVMGSAATYFFLKNREEEEVIEFVPDEKKKTPFDSGYLNPLSASGKDKTEYSNRLDCLGYSEKYGEQVEISKDEAHPIKHDDPYVISPEDYDDNTEHSKMTLKYFKDGFLVDDSNTPIDEVAEIVGDSFMDHFGEYEEDTVYIRNDQKKYDFEILYVDIDFLDQR